MVEALKYLQDMSFTELFSQAENLLSEKQVLTTENATLLAEKETLQFQLEQLKRMIFGSKRERFISADNPNQLALTFDINNEQLQQAIEAVKEQVVYERTKRTDKPHQGRMPLPSHLPVNEIVLEPLEDTTNLTYIGQEVTDELDYTPAKLHINRYIRNKYITPENELGNQDVKIASLDFRPVPKCIASSGLLAQIVVDKYVDHLPVYRQLQRFARDGVTIPSSTIESWQKLTAQLLYPLYECHRQYVIQNNYLQIDESPIRVQDKDKKGATHQGYMWVYHAPIQKAVYFDFRKGRSSESPLEVLRGFEGYMQTDGYAVYEQFAKSDQITGVACWAHARRMFDKALDYDKETAQIVLTLIQQIYHIERKAKEQQLDSQQRKELRLNEALPILNTLSQFIVEQNKYTLPKCPLGRAFDYAIKRWDSLMSYLFDGFLEIDNNLVENAIRPLALGRKNYLFAGSYDSAKNIAMFYSFFATCKKHDLHPQRWLEYVLQNINHIRISELKSLLPQYFDHKLLE